MKNTKWIWPINSTKHGVHGLTKSRGKALDESRSVPGPLHICCGCEPSVFKGQVTVGAVYRWLFACSWNFLPLVGCLVQSPYAGFNLVFCILFCPVCQLFEPCSSLKNKRKGSGSEGEERRGTIGVVEGRETGWYVLREELIFNKKLKRFKKERNI